MTIEQYQKTHIQSLFNHLFLDLWNGKALEDPEGKVPETLDKQTLKTSIEEISACLTGQQPHPIYDTYHKHLQDPSRLHDIQQMGQLGTLTRGDVRLYMVEYVDSIIMAATEKLAAEPHLLPPELAIRGAKTTHWLNTVHMLEQTIRAMPDHHELIPTTRLQERPSSAFDEHEEEGLRMGLTREDVRSYNYGKHTVEGIKKMQLQYPRATIPQLFDYLSGHDETEVRALTDYNFSKNQFVFPNFGEHTLRGMDKLQEYSPQMRGTVIDWNAHFPYVAGLTEEQVIGLTEHHLDYDQVIQDNFNHVTLDAMKQLAKLSPEAPTPSTYAPLQDLGLSSQRALAYYGMSLGQVAATKVNGRKYAVRTLLDAIDQQRGPRLPGPLDSEENIAVNYTHYQDLKDFDYHQLWGMAYCKLSQEEVEHEQYNTRRLATIALSKPRITGEMTLAEEQDIRHAAYREILPLTPEQQVIIAMYGVSVSHVTLPDAERNKIIQIIEILSTPEQNDKSPFQVKMILRKNYLELDQYLAGQDHAPTLSPTDMTAIEHFGFTLKDLKNDNKTGGRHYQAMASLAKHDKQTPDIMQARARLAQVQSLTDAQLSLIIDYHFTIENVQHPNVSAYGDAARVLMDQLDPAITENRGMHVYGQLKSLSDMDVLAVAYYGFRLDMTRHATLNAVQQSAIEHYGFTQEQAQATRAVLDMDAINSLTEGTITSATPLDEAIALRKAAHEQIKPLSMETILVIAHCGVKLNEPRLKFPAIDMFLGEKIDPAMPQQERISLRRNANRQLHPLSPLQRHAAVYFGMPPEYRAHPDNEIHIKATLTLLQKKITTQLRSPENRKLFAKTYPRVSKLSPEQIACIMDYHFALNDAENPHFTYIKAAIDRHIAALPAAPKDLSSSRQQFSESFAALDKPSKSFVMFQGMTMDEIKSPDHLLQIALITMLTEEENAGKSFEERVALQIAMHETTTKLNITQQMAMTWYNVTMAEIHHPELGLHLDTVNIMTHDQIGLFDDRQELHRAAYDTARLQSRERNEAIAYFGYEEGVTASSAQEILRSQRLESHDEPLPPLSILQQCAIANYGMHYDDTTQHDVARAMHAIDIHKSTIITEEHTEADILRIHHESWQQIKAGDYGRQVDFGPKPRDASRFAPEVLRYLTQIIPDGKETRSDTLAHRNHWLDQLGRLNEREQRLVVTFEPSLKEVSHKDVRLQLYAAEALRAASDSEKPPRSFFDIITHLSTLQALFIVNNAFTPEEVKQESSDFHLAATHVLTRDKTAEMSAQERRAVTLTVFEQLAPLQQHQHKGIAHYGLTMEEVTKDGFSENTLARIEQHIAPSQPGTKTTSDQVALRRHGYDKLFPATRAPSPVATWVAASGQAAASSSRQV